MNERFERGYRGKERERGELIGLGILLGFLRKHVNVQPELLRLADRENEMELKMSAQSRGLTSIHEDTVYRSELESITLGSLGIWVGVRLTQAGN